jgi:hypothetical protein
MRAFAARVEAATPPDRDRVIDLLRAVSIACVVLGHWLVTALVFEGARITLASPIAAMPPLAAVTWLLQVLGVFFLVGGNANARGLASSRAAGRSYADGLAARARRLGRPVAVVLVVWAAVGAVLWALGVPASTLGPVLLLVVQPLWFVAVYLAVTALTPFAVAAQERLGVWSAVPWAVVVAAVDVVGSTLGWEAVGYLTVVPAWMVAYALGVAMAKGGLSGRRAGLVLMGVGGTAAAFLVAVAGYPASLVGVTGAARSNLNPPTLLVPAVSVLQAGLVLAVSDRLSGLARRPSVWAAVALVNLAAMTIFCWHQTALVAVTLLTRPAGVVPGLHDAPDGPGWVLARLLALPVFALVLGALLACFARFERARTRRGYGGADGAGDRRQSGDRVRGVPAAGARRAGRGPDRARRAAGRGGG